MKKLSVLFVLLCLPTFAFGDVCSLSFRGGYKTEKNVVFAEWFKSGDVYFEDASGGVVPVNGHFDYDKKNFSLDKLESVNGKHISVPNLLPESALLFNCNKWQNGEYFAYYCNDGFRGGNKVGVYYEINFKVDLDVYDECIKEKAQTSDKNGGVAAATTKSGSVMKNDSNATGILDCIDAEGDWYEENENCSFFSYNSHSTKAICKKFVADAYYKKYKDNTGMTGEGWPDGVHKLPELIDGKYMLRCVATECEDEYELARDKNGNSQGWCRKKKSAPAPVLADGGCMFTFDDGTVVGPASNVHMITNDPEKWSSIVKIEVYDDDFNLLDTKKPGANCRKLKAIGDIDISLYIPEGALGMTDASCHSVKIEACDESKGYYYFEGIADEPEPIYTPTNPQIRIRNLCVKKNGGKTTQEEIKKSDDVFAKIDNDLKEHFAKTSVWKNDEGKLNTARLASDSIAGVVLGTVGGVVTSKVIKKNQVKKGFEDLKCTIAGQTVATYGDDFQVGVDK